MRCAKVLRQKYTCCFKEQRGGMEWKGIKAIARDEIGN